MKRISRRRRSVTHHVGQRLQIVVHRGLEEGRNLVDSLCSGRVNLFTRSAGIGRQLFYRGEARGGFLEIGCVSALGAGCHEVFAGVGVDHELLGLGAAHGTGIGLDGYKLKAAALENTAIDGIVQVEALVQPGAVDVKRVGVLHGELAHAQQPTLGTRLVAELGLDLVPDLGKLLVAAQFLARDVGHDLFVGHAQTEVGAFAILEAEHVVAHHAPTAAGLPDLARIQRREVELLADGVHLLAHDAGDLEDGPLGEEEVGVDSRRQLADVSGAHQELVAGDFGVGRSFTEGGDEQLGPALHRDSWIPVLR